MKIDPLAHFEKILFLKRYSKQTIDSYISHLRMAQGFLRIKILILLPIRIGLTMFSIW